MIVVAWCYFWMSVFACAAMVGLPVGCAVGMTASSDAASPSFQALLLMMAARLALAVVCVFGLVTVLVSSVVMSVTPGPCHARGRLGYFWMSVFACAAMVGLPVGCAVGMTASLGTIVLLVH